MSRPLVGVGALVRRDDDLPDDRLPTPLFAPFQRFLGGALLHA